MRRALIGGIGNVLLGDDGVGPYILRLLDSRYRFGDDVELADLGTPALDLTHQIVGLRSLILIDSVASDEQAPGTVVFYRKEDIMSIAPTERLDPHSPALSECLLTAEMLGASPEQVLLVGIVGGTYEPGEPMSSAVRASVEEVVEAVLEELQRLGFRFEKKSSATEAGIWWGENYHAERIEPRA
ncbi:MAG TPA: hydrogenase maturation protease [Candidatus Binatia bacterium]|nr:hydrogenase maturation protease [Candidatus Binatia bacterium]